MRRHTTLMATMTTMTAMTAMTAMTTAGCRHDFGEGGGATRGEKARLFKSVNEDLQPVEMQALIDGRPLVLAVGSAS